ncbi:MAG: hypothetical protein U0271_10710 [Polyangiaceae bacterium]
MLFVACWGIDAVVGLDAWTADPFRAEQVRANVPSGPSGVVFDASRGELLVHSQLGGAISVLDGTSLEVRHVVRLDRVAPSATIERGRAAFFSTGDGRGLLRASAARAATPMASTTGSRGSRPRARARR